MAGVVGTWSRKPLSRLGWEERGLARITSQTWYQLSLKREIRREAAWAGKDGKQEGAGASGWGIGCRQEW